MSTNISVLRKQILEKRQDELRERIRNLSHVGNQLPHFPGREKVEAISLIMFGETCLGYLSAIYELEPKYYLLVCSTDEHRAWINKRWREVFRIFELVLGEKYTIEREPA